MNIYLDWNVYDRIEKRLSLPSDEQQVYVAMYDSIKVGKYHAPYSNAHLNDLIRGYKKNPSFIEGHLHIIEDISNNLCICQYWKQSTPVWHIRSVRDFFRSAINEKETQWETFDDLIEEKHELSESVSLSPLMIMKPLLQMKPIPADFKKVYQADPIFNVIYPRTKTEMTEYALCCDIYSFSIMLNKDFSLYKSLRKLLIQTLNNYRQNPQLVRTLNKINPDIPKYLDMDALFDKVEIKKATGVESAYDKFFDVFFRFDLKGYKSDNQFPNMIDDALHSYYAAQCEYFITNDERCKYKAEKTFERLKISTSVLTAQEFAEIMLTKNI